MQLATALTTVRKERLAQLGFWRLLEAPMKAATDLDVRKLNTRFASSSHCTNLKTQVIHRKQLQLQLPSEEDLKQSSITSSAQLPSCHSQWQHSHGYLRAVIEAGSLEGARILVIHATAE